MKTNLRIILVFVFSTALSHPTATATLGGPESVAKASRNQPITGTRGMVVSDDRVASEWGATILRQGGNAVDAAVATAFALSVTRPHYASLGGGGFLLFCPSPQGRAAKCQSLDFREKAPITADRDLFFKDGKPNTHLSQNGALASGVPGNPAGLLTALERFGTKSRKQILKFPIQLARSGFVFTTHEESAAQARWENMNDEAKKIFGCTDPTTFKKIPCPPGTKIKQSDLAQVLETISQKGIAGFYQGQVAKKIIGGIQKAGGILTETDFKSYQPKLREPLVGRFNGYDVISMGPPSSGGIVLLQLLNYSDQANHSGLFQEGFGSAKAIHTMTHAMGLAFADRANFLGDPDFVSMPLKRLMSPEYLEQNWKTFNIDSAAIPPSKDVIEEKHPHTTHLSVIDSQGNAVAMTVTVNDNFGSAFVPPGTGIVMNNEMDDFSIHPGVPNNFGLIGSEANSIASEKRPLSSMTPTILLDSSGTPRFAIGAAGGPRIITSVFQSLINRLIFQMSIQDAVNSPRIHEQWVPKTVTFEKFSFPFEVKSIIEKKGYSIQDDITLGKVHAIERLENGRTSGAADPRGEGAPVAE